MNWTHFPYIALISSICWLIASGLLYLDKNNKHAWLIHLLHAGGTLVLGYFIFSFWQYLGRPPLRTLGETRLWYSFFLPLVGYLTLIRWKYKWFVLYTSAMAILFLLINYLHPENYSKTLMPALQSPWFVPHVIVYIFSYALLAASSVVALKGLYTTRQGTFEVGTLKLADNLVYTGFSFLTLGLIFGALWAKEAWGHYWTWDPKETWAFLTWLGYLVYMHYRVHQPKKVTVALWTLALAFVVLIICWFGLNYLPAARDSVHVYS